jgi:hypothetical protein
METLRVPGIGDPLEQLSDAVEKLKNDKPNSYTEHPKSRLLERILELVLVGKTHLVGPPRPFRYKLSSPPRAQELWPMRSFIN